jgi:Flp pilus assembly protein TadG
MNIARPHRRGERGQAVPIIALASVVLIGACALAVDLGVQTHYRRNLQNITDAASLAGAKSLNTAGGRQSERVSAVKEALAVVHTQLTPGIPLGTDVLSWAASIVTNQCGALSSSCTVTLNDASVAPYTILVATPPVNGNFTAAELSPSSDASSYLEVDLTEKSNNGLSPVIGIKTGTEGAHSVALHTPSDETFGFALFADQWVSSGNASELVHGNVYAANFLNPASNGQASICAQGGSVVLGAPQSVPPATSGNTQTTAANQQNSAKTITFLNDCSTASSGVVAQTQPEGCNVPGVTMPSNSYVDDSGYVQTVPSGVTMSGSKACVANPSFKAPTYDAPPTTSPATYDCTAGQTGLVNGQYQDGTYTCPLTVDHPLKSGVYTIIHKTNNGNNTSADLIINSSVNLAGVTFVFQNNGAGEGPTVQITKNGTVVTQTPYCPSGHPPGTCVFPDYAPAGVNLTWQLLSGASFSAQGTFYAPSGNATIDNGCPFNLVGQVIVNQWTNNSGFHPDPNITYDSGASAPLHEDYRLVE